MSTPIKDLTLEEIRQLPKLNCLFIYSQEDNRDKYQLWVVLDAFVKSKPIDLGASMSIVALNQRWTHKPKLREKRTFKLHARLTKGLTKEPGKSGHREWFYRIELFMYRKANKTTTISAFIAQDDIPYVQSTNLDDMFSLIGQDSGLIAKDKAYA